MKSEYEKYQKLGLYVNVFPYWNWIHSEIKYAFDALSIRAGRGNYAIPIQL